MDYEAKIKIGQYQLDHSAFMDVRITDMGACISVCDVDANVRYTALIDKGVLLLGEVQELVRENTIADLAAAVAGTISDPSWDDTATSVEIVEDEDSDSGIV